MGSLSVSPELSLDFRPTNKMFVPRTITDLLKEVSMIGDAAVKGAKVGSFLNELEEELRKIDAFKRELPLCMLLLNDAIRILKEESRQCEASSSKPVLEEFIPLKLNCVDDDDHGDGGDREEMSSVRKEKDSRDEKKHWMSTFQLGSTDNVSSFEEKQNLKPEPKISKENQYAIGDTLEVYKSRSAARSFFPFKGLSMKEDDSREELPIPDLSLLTPGIKNLKEESSSTDSRSSCHRVVSTSAPNSHSDLRNGPQPPQQSSSRKQRRCWSPDLHRRFVNALQQLGGTQAATPKQIRELMQVDGLTNDEVKSHLQKYRLHTRRTSSPSITTTATPANQSVVVLGGLWMNQDQYGDTTNTKANSSQSGSPQGPLQLAGHTRGTSTTGGDSIEDDEDAKSEGYSSWKR